MGKTKVIEISSERCKFCGRPATKLCDKVKGTSVAIDKEGPGVISHHIHHCDNLICDRCTTQIDGADYCPDCIRKLKKALN